MRAVIAGSSGLIGTALRRSYEDDGHEVVRLVRRPARAPGELSWDPAAPDPGLVDGADVLVNLAGAGLGDRRWTRRHKDAILRSRIDTARALAAMTAAAAAPPRVFVSASGMRYYGVDRGDEMLTESSDPAAPGFLPLVAREWEAATAGAGVPVCHLRMALVLSGHGGVLPQLVRWFRTGLGGRIGSGREYWSYVSLADTVRAIRFLAAFLTGRPDAAGPYNIAAPEPVRSAEFTRELAGALGRPAALRVPVWALRAAVGGAATEVFASLRVVPAALTGAGFAFDHPDVRSVLRAALAAPGDPQKRPPK